jgi:hypothetical protein
MSVSCCSVLAFSWPDYDDDDMCRTAASGAVGPLAIGGLQLQAGARLIRPASQRVQRRLPAVSEALCWLKTALGGLAPVYRL